MRTTTLTLEQRAEAKRQRGREYRRRHYLEGRQPGLCLSRGDFVTVPDDVERVETHEPCLACGQSRGPCRHRPWA